MEAHATWKAEPVIIHDLVAWVRSMEVESIWKAEVAVVTVQRKKMGSGYAVSEE